ncbi:DUF6691 family protein [Janthinobacterium sp. B9-8]|uniref:DUF6691 family protein n=1 Tax=Janthinobacterium sp. B9-8 TaxID=1236179 RepID=UPI00061CEAF7|nr:DUF6691 family protein [Janthinobacterium sp. B9-8]AMC33668.1 hypothetical protein VN23_03180 [Janthinobacterium sp. B9-8]
MLKLIALLSGLLFSLGLIISGMVNPAKVIGFLDLAGQWDPSLALVMTGAIATATPFFIWAKSRKQTLLTHEKMSLPDSKIIDRPLIGGSILFGIGWGLAGICPGPGIVALAMGEAKAFIFVIAMLVGMFIFTLLPKKP